MSETRAIKVGELAPDFELKDQDENIIKLSDLRGKKVLLSFHPLAWTGICRDQMLSLENNFEKFKQNNTVPLGISIDAFPSKKAWADEIGLKNLKILSDFWEHGKVAKAYGSFIDKLGFSGRANILIDEEGKVKWVKVYPVKQLPEINEVLEAIK